MEGPEAPLLISLFLVGCESVDPVDSAGRAPAELDPTDMPTVFTLAWDSPEQATSRLEYGLDGVYDHVVAAVDSEDGLHHEARVALGAGETWSWRVMDGDTVGQSGEQLVDAAPKDLPHFSVTEGEASPTGGYTIGTSPETPSGTAVWVIDSAGRYVWWVQSSAEHAEITQVWPGVDADWIEWIERSPGRGLRRMRVDGSDEERLDLPNAHHDFIPLPDGAYAMIERQELLVDGELAVSDGIIEVTPDGHVRRVFRAEDWITLDLADGENIGDGLEVVHGNGLIYDAPSDRYYLSSWCRSSVMAVDRASGALIWEIGGPHTQYPLLGGTEFFGQHAPRIDDGALMVFDNGDMDGLSSRVAAFDVDEVLQTYTQRWEHRPEPSLFTPVLGNADRQEDGGLFISWGTTGRVELVDAEMQATWRLDASLGGAVGYAHHVATFLGSAG